jgi:hypothetical protein
MSRYAFAFLKHKPALDEKIASCKLRGLQSSARSSPNFSREEKSAASHDRQRRRRRLEQSFGHREREGRWGLRFRIIVFRKIVFAAILSVTAIVLHFQIAFSRPGSLGGLC